MAPSLHKPQLFTLSNGLTLIVEEDHSLPIATVQAWCATGSIHEGVHLGSGLSHLLEHMLFKGTAKRPSGTILEEMNRAGAIMNGCTRWDHTVYFLTLPSSSAADAIDILADMMMNASIPLEEYTKEQEVIRREFAMKNDHPFQRNWELYHRAAFQTSPVREPILGHLNLFNKLTRDEVMAYYKKRYVPNNLCFVVVGDVEAQAIKSQLEALFEKEPRQSLEPLFVPKEPEQLVKRVERESSLLNNITHLNFLWKTPIFTSSEAPAIEVLSALLAFGKSSFLQQVLCEKKGLVHAVFAHYKTLSQQESFLRIETTVDAKKRDAAERELLHQIELLKSRGVSAQEVERSKNLILSSHWDALSHVNIRAYEYGSSWLLAGDPSFHEEYVKAISRVTPEEVNRVANRYLIENRLTITSLDSKASKAHSVPITAVPEKRKKKNIIQKFTLPNGLRLLIHEDSKVPLISMTALFRGGLLAEEEKTSGLTSLLTSTIIKGTRSKSAQEIAQILEQVGGTINACDVVYKNPVCTNDSFGVSLNLMKPYLQLGLTLLAEILIEPTFPEAEVAREKEKQLAAIKQEKELIGKVALTLLQKKLFGTHPYARQILGTAASVEAFTPEIVREFYQQYVVGNNGVIAIFGNVHAEEVLAIATKAFANLPSGSLAFSSVLSAVPLATPIHEEALEERQQAVIIKGFLSAAVTSSDRPALEILSAACSGGGSRLFKEIRDKKALVYHVSGSNQIGLAPGNFLFSLSVDPKKRAFALQELNHLLEQLVQKGLTQEELEQAKKFILHLDALSHQSNATFGRQVAKDELMGLGFEHTYHRKEEILGVTLDQVNAAIKKYLDAPGFVEVVVGPKAVLSEASLS